MVKSLFHFGTVYLHIENTINLHMLTTCACDDTQTAHVRIFLISLAEVDILERQVAEQVAYFPFVVGCWALVFVVVFRAIFVVVLVLIDGPRDVCVSDVLESLAVMAVILIHFYDELYGLFCFFGSGAQAVASAHFTFE